MFDFVNSGVQSFLKEDFEKNNNISIAVIGIPRSGTTAIASGLENVGISFGKNLSNVKEDRNFANACNSINSKKEISNINLRKGLVNKNIHPDGKCGFTFDLNEINEEIDLKQIAVKIKDTSFYLTKNLYSLTK